MLKDIISKMLGIETDTSDAEKAYDSESERISEIEQNSRLQIATAALFIEVAKADEHFSDEERKATVGIIHELFKIDEKTFHRLFEISEGEQEDSVSLYEFTEVLNKNLDHNEKFEILKNLWKLAYADGKLDKYEEYIIKKISSNLHMSQRDTVIARSMAK